MKYKIEIAKAASLDLIGIVDYVAQSSTTIARQYHDDIIAKFKLLETEPNIGRPHTVRRLRAKGYRELIVESHIAHYIVDQNKNQVNIVRVLHQSMNQERHLKNI